MVTRKYAFVSHTGTLAVDTTTSYCGETITIPAGTRMRTIEAGTGPLWAVADIAALIRLTGNTHDPAYRWCTVPPGAAVDA